MNFTEKKGLDLNFMNFDLLFSILIFNFYITAY